MRLVLFVEGVFVLFLVVYLERIKGTKAINLGVNRQQVDMVIHWVTDIYQPFIVQRYVRLFSFVTRWQKKAVLWWKPPLTLIIEMPNVHTCWWLWNNFSKWFFLQRRRHLSGQIHSVYLEPDRELLKSTSFSSYVIQSPFWTWMCSSHSVIQLHLMWCQLQNGKFLMISMDCFVHQAYVMRWVMSHPTFRTCEKLFFAWFLVWAWLWKILQQPEMYIHSHWDQANPLYPVQLPQLRPIIQCSHACFHYLPFRLWAEWAIHSLHVKRSQKPPNSNCSPQCLCTFPSIHHPCKRVSFQSISLPSNVVFD